MKVNHLEKEKLNDKFIKSQKVSVYTSRFNLIYVNTSFVMSYIGNRVLESL